MQLTPGFFDALVLFVITAGLILAALRIRHDFRSGPRFSDDMSVPVMTQKPKTKAVDTSRSKKS